MAKRANKHHPQAKQSEQGRQPKGEGSVFQRKDGRWVAQVTLPTGEQKQWYTKTEKEAAKKLRDALHEVEQGSLIPGKDHRLGAFLDHWLEHIRRRALKISTYLRYRDILDVHILPRLGHLSLRNLAPEHLERFYARKMEEGLSERTIHIMHTIMHQALALAVKRRLIATNVCDEVDLPRVPTYEARTFSKEEARAFLRAVKGTRFEVLFTVALLTGMRRGELLALRWEDINWEEGSIHVRRTVNRYGKGQGYVISDTKTAASRRKILFPPLVRDLLTRHREQQITLRERAQKTWQEQGLVFSSRVGTIINPNYVGEELRAVLERAHLPRMRFHDLRHSTATLLLGEGVHPKVVQELLGHSTIRMTLDTYSHVLPSLHQEAVYKLQAVFEEVPKNESPPPSASTE